MVEEAICIKSAKHNLEFFYWKKSIRKARDFTFFSEKMEGVNSGAIFTDRTHLYMVKATYKSNQGVNPRHYGERRDWLHEYIMAPFFKRFLYDRAAHIELVDVPYKLKDRFEGVYLSSCYIENFINFNIDENEKDFFKYSTVSQILEGDIDVQGFEKVMAVSAFLADFGYHKGNIGVTRYPNDNQFYVAKIDYGRSAYFFDKLEINILIRLATGTETYGLDKIKFSLVKFLDEVKEITKLREDEIRNFIGSQLHKLKKFDYDITDPHRERSFRSFPHYSKEESTLFFGLPRKTFFPYRELLIAERIELFGDKLTIKEERQLLDNLMNEDSYRGKLLRENHQELFGCTLHLSFLDNINCHDNSLKKLLQYLQAEDFYVEKLIGHLNLFKELERSLGIISQAQFTDNQEFINDLWLVEILERRFVLELLIKRWDKILNKDFVTTLLKDYRTYQKGNSVLMEALLYGDDWSVKFLAKFIDHNIVNMDGLKAIDFAINRNIDLISSPFIASNIYDSEIIISPLIDTNQGTLTIYQSNYINIDGNIPNKNKDLYLKYEVDQENNIELTSYYKEPENDYFVSYNNLIRNSDTIIRYFKIYGIDLSFLSLSSEIKLALDLTSQFIPFHMSNLENIEVKLFSSFSYYLYSKTMFNLSSENFSLIKGLDETCIDEFIIFSIMGIYVGSPTSGFINAIEFCLKENNIAQIDNPIRDGVRVAIDSLVSLFVLDNIYDWRISGLDKFILTANSAVLTDALITSIYGVVDYLLSD